MEETALHFQRANIAGNDLFLADKQVGTNIVRFIRVVGDNIGIAFDSLTFLLFQIEALFLLQLILFLEYFAEHLRNHDLLNGFGFLFYLPAVGAQVFHTGIIVTDFVSL